MSRELLIETEGDEVRAALLEDGTLVDLIVERENGASIVGNIYLGRVERVIPGIGAAFVDIGRGKSGFLPLSERRGGEATGEPVIEGGTVFVQAKRDAFAEKGPQLARELSLPGRFLVYAPSGGRLSVSRQIENESERDRLLSIISDIAEEGEGFVLRTVADGAEHDVLAAEAQYLRDTWQSVLEEREVANAPALLYSELNALQRAIRDQAQDDVVIIRFDDNAAYGVAKAYCDQFYPALTEKLAVEPGPAPLFDQYNIEEAIETALSRNAPLPSGGGLVIESMEALTAVDVNSGRFTEGSSPDENARKTNVEAAVELTRQIRLRNLGGLIVVDFIHMDDEAGWEEIFDALRQGFSRDRVSCRVVGRTEGGLVELIRRRRRPPLSETLLDKCPECGGDGYVWRTESLIFEALRSLRREAAVGAPGRLMLNASPEILEAIERSGNNGNPFSRVGRQVVTQVMPDFGPEEYEIFIDGDGNGGN
ncbi:MAG: Rne/Rng family ribonuclease [Alphaproteobacteria bacterium]|nr:Rne/Rng family ribonuclease [Alphaproteobacteria bacterium]